ncbi:2-oxoacid:ferredoxin oxidoreductase subunit beta [candidate division WOR-3 bacterium RBG_13_43_14]|uniref:2-oxoacid:ferredoxin oxidoreductase subunit beta n=1 Tax=candidate division WOR-3 bacterium RBG_13_43_14 TaxID=1802590 RepID=A0A1F4U1K2_UNCW3|nr:MAG: 2-oxoacid:ferredoxin oxidoreductase subunit beta [candidate division WOR-3 bacterium RBG_13_43_14]
MFPYSKYLRTNRLPHIWCTGCGCGIILKAMLRAVDRSGIDRNTLIFVSGIGCSSRTPGYIDFDTLHTTHGRALAFATGIKLAKPEMKVIVLTGDGDACAIGGNHFIHAARRNLDLTVILYNNRIYGMTGGQPSPTTPYGEKGTTAPYGSIEPSFDVCRLAAAAGAVFVARSTCYHATQLDKLILKAMNIKGFSLVEILSPCPTYYAHLNRLGTSLDLLMGYKRNSIPVEKARRLDPSELKDKIVTGVIYKTERPEYFEEYHKLQQGITENGRLR